jgi:predicted RNase H-like HicB family nuclease
METTDIVLWLVIGICIGATAFYLTLKLAVNILMRRLARDIEQLEVELNQHQKTIQARVELHNNEFFVYNNDTNEFMAQGATLQDLRKRIRDRWSTYQVSVVAGDENVLAQLKEQLNENSCSQ